MLLCLSVEKNVVLYLDSFIVQLLLQLILAVTVLSVCMCITHVHSDKMKEPITRQWLVGDMSRST